MLSKKPRVLKILVGGAPLREPWPAEVEFFRSRPEVSAMATDDNAVVLNPYSALSKDQVEAVLLNEAARVFMRVHGPRPKFCLTSQQAEAFAGYGTTQDIRETVAARLLSGDLSAGTPTDDQKAFVSRLALLLNLSV